MLLRVHGMARLPAAGSRPRDAEWAYGDSGVRTGVRNWPGAAFTFLEFCLQVVLPVLLRANGRTTASLAQRRLLNTNIFITMSDTRRSPTTTPRSGGKGPTTRSKAARGARLRGHTPKADSASGVEARSAPRGPGKGQKGTGKQPGAATDADEALRTPYTAQEISVQGLGTPSRRAHARSSCCW